MYRRFLNNDDYSGTVTKESLNQLTRGEIERVIKAEESAEISIIEHLSENYEIESELNKGKYIADYNRAITYPVGVHLYFDGKIHEVIRSISSYKSPADKIYWQEYTEIIPDSETLNLYSQLSTYYPKDIVVYNGTVYICLFENGYKFDDIRIPGVEAWIELNVDDWLPVIYHLWDVVRYQGSFYTLIDLVDFDNNIPPDQSENWGEIADYDCEYNSYELCDHEYVIYNGRVFYPEIDVNSDIPQVGTNLVLHDPRNYNIKKHMVRLALYELTKLIAPNNVSVVRLKDYEDSMKWLSDAARFRLNPQIPRKIGDDKKPVTDWQLATFQTDYDPYKNPWMV